MMYLVVKNFGDRVSVSFRRDPFGYDTRPYVFKIKDYRNFEIRFLHETNEIAVLGKDNTIYAFRNGRELELFTARKTLNNDREGYLPWQYIFYWDRFVRRR